RHGLEDRESCGGGVYALQAQTGTREEGFELFACAFLAAGSHQHVDVQELGPIGLVAGRNDVLDDEHATLWRHGRPAVAQDDLALVIVPVRSEEHTSELQSHLNLVCRLL